MIASLRGTVIGIGLDHAVIECAGVGYRVEATPTTLATLRRGYAVLQDTEGHVLSSVQSVAAGTEVMVRLTDGRVHATTTRTEPIDVGGDDDE